MSVSTPSRSVYFFGSIAAYIWKCKVLNEDNADDNDNIIAINDPYNLKEASPHSEEEKEQQLYINLKASASVPSLNEPCIEETFGAISSTSPLPLHSFECAPGASMRALFLPVLIEKAHCLSPEENKLSNNDNGSCSSEECTKNEMNSLTLNIALTLQLSSIEDCQGTNVQHTKTINDNNKKDNNKGADGVKSYVSSLEESSTIELTKFKAKSSVRLVQCGHAEKIITVKEVDVMSHNDECMLVKMGICYDKPSQNTQDNQSNSIIENNNNKKEEQETREEMTITSTLMQEQIHAEVFIILRVINLTSTMRLLLIADETLNKFIRSESTELLANKLHDSMTVTVSPVDDFPHLQYTPDNQICMDHSEYKNNKCSQSSLSYLSFGAIPLTELYRHYRLLCGVAFNKIIKHSNAVLKLLMPSTHLHSYDSDDKNKSKYSELYENTSIDENRFAHSLVRLSAQTRAKRITSTHIHGTNAQIKENRKEHPENPETSSEEVEKEEEESEEESSVILQTFIAFR